MNTIRVNLLIIFLGTLIAFIVALNTSRKMPASSNIGAIYPLIKSILFGLITLIIYLVFRKTLREYNWVISIIGIAITIYASSIP